MIVYRIKASSKDFESNLCLDEETSTLSLDGLEIAADKDTEDVVDMMDSIVSFHAPEEWNLTVFAKDKVNTKTFTKTFQIAEFARHWRNLNLATQIIDGIADEECEVGTFETFIYRASIMLTRDFISNMIRSYRRVKKILLLKDKECPVLNIPLNKDNGVVLNCNHCVSKDAWEKINSVEGAFPCPLCRHKHFTRFNVAYAPQN